MVISRTTIGHIICRIAMALLSLIAAVCVYAQAGADSDHRDSETGSSDAGGLGPGNTRYSFPIRSQLLLPLSDFESTKQAITALTDYDLHPEIGLLPLAAFQTRQSLAIDTRVGSLRILADFNRYQIAPSLTTLQSLASIANAQPELATAERNIADGSAAILSDEVLGDTPEADAIRDTQAETVVDLVLPELEPVAADSTLFLKEFRALFVSELVYDENVFASLESGDALMNSNDLQLSAAFQRRKSTYLASYNYGMFNYIDGPAIDYRNQRAYIDLDQEIGRRNRLALSYQYDTTQENRGTGILEGIDASNIDAIDVVSTGLTLRHTLGDDESRMQIRTELFSNELEYDRTAGIVDVASSETTGINFDVRYNLGARTRLIGSITHDAIDYANDDIRDVIDIATLDASSYRYDFGVEKDIGKISGITVLLGQYERSFKANIAGEQFSTWSVEYTINPKSYSRFSASYGQQFAPSRGVGTFIKTDELRLSWNHSWTNKLRTRMNFGLFDDEFIGAARQDQRRSFNLVTEYAHSDALRFALGARYVDRESNENTLQFHRNIYFFRTTYRF